MHIIFTYTLRVGWEAECQLEEVVILVVALDELTALPVSISSVGGTPLSAVALDVDIRLSAAEGCLSSGVEASDRFSLDSISLRR